MCVTKKEKIIYFGFSLGGMIGVASHCSDIEFYKKHTEFIFHHKQLY